MYELVLRCEFSAAHQLRMADGSVEPLHDHDWQVEVYLEGEALDECGLVMDFTEVQERLREIASELHHTTLNELPAFGGENPSTERVARHIHNRLAPRLPEGVRPRLVRVWETGVCAAGYSERAAGGRGPG